MSKVIPVNEEFILSEGAIVSQTDISGVITYVNRKFCEVSGYSANEVVGKNHNIVRHPDMPRAVYVKMWESIRGGQAWNGLLKNLRKDGRYYWVETEILPVRSDDEKESIIGYIAVRKLASKKDIQENEEIYKKMLQAEK